MNLVSALCSGIAGAANGWAEVYIRGTSTRATIYGDFEASTSNSSGDDIPLDAYGAAEVYVNQLVDIVAKSPDGTVVRSWTDGYASRNIEVISPSFTGNDYVSGASATDEPTTLHLVLNRWLANAGAPDWKIDIGGVATTPQDAFGALDGLVFNVKAPQFGAIGDGVANDQGAIMAAIAAAGSSGGGVVFFPEGTYRTLTAITLDNTVSLQGAGAGRSVITIDSPTERILQLFSAPAVPAPFIIESLVFSASQANSATQLYLAASGSASVRDCVFCYSANCTGIGIEYTQDFNLEVVRGIFNVRSLTLPAIYGPSSSSLSIVRMSGVTIIGPDTFNGPLVNLRNTARAIVTGCHFDGLTNTTSGAGCYGIQVTNRSTITGNIFDGSPLDAAIRYDAGTVATATANSFIGCTTRYAVSAILAAGSYLELEPLVNVTSSATPVIPDGVGTIEFRSTTTVPTFTLPTKLYPGQELKIILINLSGAGWATPITLAGAGVVSGVPSPNVGNAASATYALTVCDLTGGFAYLWRRYYTIG